MLGFVEQKSDVVSTILMVKCTDELLENTKSDVDVKLLQDIWWIHIVDYNTRRKCNPSGEKITVGILLFIGIIISAFVSYRQCAILSVLIHKHIHKYRHIPRQQDLLLLLSLLLPLFVLSILMS